MNALVFSKMYYCFPVWSNTSNKDFLKLQSVQNIAARVITGVGEYDHVTHILSLASSWKCVKIQGRGYDIQMHERISSILFV